MAFRTQKISQMTPKGADLEATDLIEVSTIESGSYVTRSITGQELIDAIPPTTIEWGDIGGTLSDQTDLNTALNGKVPTTRNLTINGVTQDLSADRTFTIATGLTIGTTAITSGTVGRILFEGTGNVVQESANLFWDNTNGRLGIGGTPGAFNLDVVGSARTLGTSQIRSSSGSVLGSNLTTTAAAIFYNNGFSGVVGVGSYANSGGEIQSAQNGGLSVGGFLTLQRQGGNVLIGTATDAGFKLDVNGTARVSGRLDNYITGAGTSFLSGNSGAGAVRIGIYTDNSSYSAVYTEGSHDLRLATGSSVGAIANVVMFKDSNKSLGIGVSPTAKLHAKGSGSTSATSSMLIENSAGTAAMRVRDDLVILLPSLPTSSAGLPTGAIWNDGGTLKIV